MQATNLSTIEVGFSIYSCGSAKIQPSQIRVVFHSNPEKVTIQDPSTLLETLHVLPLTRLQEHRTCKLESYIKSHTQEN